MQKEIPNIAFKAKDVKTRGIEVITIKSLMERQKELSHSPEKAHQLEFNLIAFYTKGHSNQFVDFIEYDVSKNTVMYLSKNQINAFSFNDSLDGYIILFTEDYFKKQLHRLPKNKTIRLFTSNLFSPQIQVPKTLNIKKYLTLFYEEYNSPKDTFNTQKILDYLFAIIISKLEQQKQYETNDIDNTDKLKLFLEFKNLVESNYTKSRDAKFYALKLNITYKHLNVICKEVVNTTAKNFIDAFIILEAKRKLINSAIKSSELAYLMGFNEPTNFVKYFKKHTGLTPNSFKNKHE